MGRRIKTTFEESLALNTTTYMFYLNKLMEIAISTISYQGLPDTVDERFIELGLFTKGQMVYFDDEVIGELCLNVMPGGSFDVYGEPILRRAYSGYNNYSKLLKKSNSVMVYNNYLRCPSVDVLTQYARKIYLLDRIAMLNANAQKFPTLITCDEKERLSAINMYKEWDGMAPVVFGNNNLTNIGLSVLKTDAPYVADKIYELKEKYWAEALTYLGIANVPYEKAERVQAMEVQSQLGGVFAYRESRVKSRQKAFDRVNRMFNLDVQVDFKAPDPTMLGLPGFQKEGEEIE